MTIDKQSRRILGSLLGLMCACIVSMPTLAQGFASDFTFGTRYDASGRVTGTIAPDPDGGDALRYAAVRNSYDSAGRLTKVETGELADWKSEAIAPASWGSAFTVHRQTEIHYDALSRKLRETVSKGSTVLSVTQYSYDTGGRLQCTAVRMNPDAFGSLPADACTLGTSGTYGPDRITRNEYDAAGQLTKVIRAYGTDLQQDYATYTYTPNGKRQTVTDANGNKAAFAYDGHDRLHRWYFPRADTGQVSTNDYEEYGYDANGNRTSLRKRSGVTLGYAFDALNRMTIKTVPGGCVSAPAGTCASATGELKVHYGYNLRGLQTHARFGSATGDGIANVFDGFGRLTRSTNSTGGVSRTLDHGYDAAGNRTRITHPDSVAFHYRYDGLDRLDRIADGSDHGLAILAYYDTGSRRWIGHDATGIGYGYDDLGRLAGYRIQHNEGAPANVVVDATVLDYNPASQIVRQQRSDDVYSWAGAANVDRSYAVNGLNQYASAGPADYGYDANGNLTSSSAPEGPGQPNTTRTYSYDPENRLYASSDGVTLAYDPLGRLFQTARAGGVVTQFLYDGDALVAEYVSDGTSRRYVHAVGEDTPVLAWETTGSGTTLRQLLADHQGSIIATAQHGWKRDRINTYDEYGIPGSGNSGRFQYTGQAWIPELGMYHYKARMYSPRLGRFLQTDPIGYEDQVNLYAYVANDPVNHRDPDGQQSEWTMDRRYIYSRLSEEQREGLEEEHSKIGESAAVGAANGVMLGGLGGLAVRGGVRAFRAYRAYYVTKNPKTGLTIFQTKSIAKFFGKGVDGAKATLAKIGESGFKLPIGVTAETLQKYKAVAERAIKAGKTPEVQRARIEVIDEALKRIS